MRNLALLVTIAATLFAAGASAKAGSGEGRARSGYLGESAPGLTPQRFAPGVVSTTATELNCAIAPDESAIFLTERRNGRNTIVFVERRGEEWAKRSIAPFSGEFADVDPAFSADGQRLYFSSNRPVDAADTRRDSNLWYVDRVGPGEWGAPVSLAKVNSSDSDEYYTSLDIEGTIYYSVFPDHDSPADLYLSRVREGVLSGGERLAGPVNTEFTEHDPFVAPDGSYLIFASDRPGGLGRSDLWISFRDGDGSWGEPKNMGAEINSAGYDFCPMLSPDGSYLFFTRNIGGDGDIYWVDAEVIEQLRGDMPG